MPFPQKLNTHLVQMVRYIYINIQLKLKQFAKWVNLSMEINNLLLIDRRWRYYCVDVTRPIRCHRLFANDWSTEQITLSSDVYHEQLYCLLSNGWNILSKYIPWPNANTIFHALPQAILVYKTSQMNLDTMYHGYHSWFLNSKCMNTYRWVQNSNVNTICRISTVIYCTSQELYTLATLQLIYSGLVQLALW